MAESIPVIAPLEALNYFRRKGYAFGFAWQDVWQQEHVRAFTVAKAMSRDLLEDIRAAVDRAIAEGRTLDQFRDELRPLLEAKGWWGRKPMTDPLTGRSKIVQLGSPRRLKTIFDVNMRMAYQAGRWERMQRNAAAFPYVRYVSAGDARVRPQHQAWHGVIRPIGDPWWDTHYPPCGWNCRCTAVPVNDRMIERRGWEVTDRPPAFMPERSTNPRTGEVSSIEAGISPGFNYNVGKAYLEDLAARPLPGPGAGVPGTSAELAARFGRALGVDAAASEQGDVFVDRGDWPSAVTPAWFEAADGSASVPGPPEQIELAARAMASPDEIRWRWVKGEDGRSMLFRRYVATIGGVDVVVDVGRAGWRFTTSAQPAFEKRQLLLGQIAWTPAAAPGEYVARALAYRSVREAPLDLRPASDALRGRLADLGLDRDDLVVAIAGEDIRHILRRHGADSRGQKAIGAEDLLRAVEILEAAELRRGTPATSRSGAPRFYATAELGGERYEAAFEIRKFRIVPVSMRKR